MHRDADTQAYQPLLIRRLHVDLMRLTSEPGEVGRLFRHDRPVDRARSL